jgi:hypothetical protein
MRKHLLTAVTTAMAVLTAAITAHADYSNTVVSLNPVAYWPLNETVQPPAPYLATNSGSWGSTANGYYETWFAPTNNGYIAKMGWTGPASGATSDGDGAAAFFDYHQYILIPHTYTNLVIKAPFSVECWAYSTNVGNWANLVSEGAQYGAASDSSGNWRGFSLGQYNGNWLFDLYNKNGSGHSAELTASATANQWSHLVATFDGTNAILYLNGSAVAAAIPTTNSAGQSYVPDVVNPIELGVLNFAHYVNSFQGSIDEAAIYTNVLANNYGSIGSGANGLYQPGTLPGMAGPTGNGFGSANYSVAINGMDAAVDVGNGNLTNVAPGLNITGTNALSVIAWFKGNPADGYNHFQSIIGHGDSGWRFGFGGSGPQFNPGGGGEIAAGDIYNDGRWHLAAGVYNSGTNYLYVDGKLASSTTFTGTNTGNGRDVFLGGAPDYTVPVGTRYWDGRLAHVALFTNALSAANILQLYTVAQMVPFISTQPVSATVNAGTAYTNSVTVGGSPVLSFQWYQNGSPVAGQTNLNLGFNPVSGANAGNYYLVVTNVNGAVTSSIVAFNVNTSPQITSQSGTNFTLFVGGSTVFKLAASGAVPLYYYWSSNSVVVSASTNSNYTLTSASASATYICLVSNFLGTVSSSPVTVTVIPAPTNTYPKTVLADSPLGFWRMDEPGVGYPNNGITAYDYWHGNNGAYTNTDLGQTGYPAVPTDPDLAALFGAEVGSDSDMQIPGIDFSASTNAEFSIELWVNATLPQYLIPDGSGIIAKGTGGGGEQFNLDTGAGSEDFRFFVRDASGGVHLANSTVTADNNWHHLVGVCDEANGSVLLYIDGKLAASSTITAGSGLKSSSNPVSVGSRQSGTGPYDNQFPGVIDEVAIYNYPLSAAQVNAHYYSIGGFAPTFVQQPTNVAVNAATTATFTAVVNGSPTLAYQWYNVTAGLPGTPVAGATNATLTLANVSSSQNGNLYDLVVTNGAGPATSSTVQLTVISGPPSLLVDLTPLSSKAFVGTPLTFSVSVGGTPPFHYQWYQDGSPVGLNTNTYSLAVIAGTNTYYCFVTNSAGSVSSSVATILGVSITDTGTNTSGSSTTFAVNFVDAANGAYTPDGGTTYYNVVYQGLGAYADNPSNTNWNGFGLFPNGYTPAPNSAVAPQVASDGTLTPVTLNLTYGFDSSPIYFGPGISGNATQGQPSVLFGATAVVNTGNPGVGTSGNPLGGITLSNVPSGTYTLYLYGTGPGNDRGAVFNFTSGTALGGTNTALNAGNGGPCSNIVYGVSYIIYTNVTPNASGVITGTWGAVVNGSNTGEGDFNGLQLVRVSGSTVVSAPVLSIKVVGTSAVITWVPSAGTLQSATSVAGPYTDIGGSTSPYTNSVTGTQQFFRVKQ